jgi:hypothetical protein
MNLQRIRIRIFWKVVIWGVAVLFVSLLIAMRG